MTSTFLPDASLLWGTASLQSGAPRAIPWLWEGYLAPGALTLLTSLWKSGKTTLVLYVQFVRVWSNGLVAS
jgi:hypothetical protein